MIEEARPIGPFGSAAEVLASVAHWVVIERTTGRRVISCRIRPASDPGRNSPMLTVRVGRHYGSLCWIKPGGVLTHAGEFADPDLPRKSREWSIVQRLWPYLARGEIPATVTIVPDEAFERERCLAFQATYPDVWRYMITKGPHKPFNDKKIALIKRFGELTPSEMESIRKHMPTSGNSQPTPKPQPPKDDWPDHFDDIPITH